MKLVSVNLQKKLMFIPGLNILNLFIWFYNSFSWDKHINTRAKTISIFLSSSLPLVIVYILFDNLAPEFSVYLRYACAYFIPLLISFRLVKYQEVLMQTIKK